MAERLRGQEVSIVVTRGSVLEDTLVNIQNFNFEPESEIQSQGYLGEKTERKDAIYKGCKGDLELHVHSQDFLRFAKAVQDQQKRITPDLVINITAVLFFADGTTPSIIVRNVKFGSIPINVANRADYVKIKLDFAADDYEIQFQ